MAGLGAGGDCDGRDPHKGHLPRAQYVRLRPRRGHKKALGAVKHSIITVIWHMLSTGELYTDLGGDYFRKRNPERVTKRLIAQLESLGHKVTLEELPQAA
jgi:transposase